MLELLGLDYQDTPAEIRGRLALADEQLASALRTLAANAAVREVAILSTCNRTEVYYAGNAPAASAIVRAYLQSLAAQPAPSCATVASASSPALSTPLDTAEPSLPLYHHSGATAAEHLLAVASGLRSMVVGEAQILGQVKDAIATAEDADTVGEELRLLFSAAVRTGKRARAETDLGRADVSLVTLAVRAAAESLGSLHGITALVIGAGRTSRLCAEQLRAAGVGTLLLANRTAEVATELANDLDAEAIPLDALAAHLPQVDLIMSATAAPSTILTAATVASARSGVTKPLTILDLAVPQDVEPATGSLPNVTLIQLDALRQDADEVTSAQSTATLARAEEIVADGLRTYLRDRTVRMAVPGIAALRRHVNRSEETERARVLASLTHLSDADRAIVERFGQRLVDKMFHHLVSRIRSLAEFDEVPPDVTMRVLSQLFADPDAPSENSADPSDAE